MNINFTKKGLYSWTLVLAFAGLLGVPYSDNGVLKEQSGPDIEGEVDWTLAKEEPQEDEVDWTLAKEEPQEDEVDWTLAKEGMEDEEVDWTLA